jgi:hypothetical protein
VRKTYSDLIPKNGQGEGGQKNNPQSNHTFDEIVRPRPSALDDCAIDMTAHQKAAKNEEHHHGLVTEACNEVEHLAWQAEPHGLGVVVEDESSYMPRDDNERGPSAGDIDPGVLSASA